MAIGFLKANTADASSTLSGDSTPVVVVVGAAVVVVVA